MSITELASENTLMRHALLRISDQLKPNSWDATEDGPVTSETYLARLPHIAKFAADMAKDVNSRPGFKQYVYEKLTHA
jgi:hypothetical protein